MRDGGDRVDPMDLEDLQSIMEVRIQRPLHGHRFRMSVEPGVYSLWQPLQEKKIPRLTMLEYSCDEPIPMSGGAYDEFRGAVEEFFSPQTRDRYARSGLLHKRGIVLHGPPGSAKTTMVREEADKWADRGRVVFYAYDPQTVTQSLKTFRRMDSRRDVVVVLEDFDELVKYGGTQRMNQMLDGVDAPQHVLFVATVNDLKALPMKLRRKGRFEEKIHVPMPTLQHRYAYIKGVAGGRLPRQICEDIARQTKGAGFGTLRDTIALVVAHGASPREAIAEARREILEERREAADRAKRGLSAEGYSIAKCGPQDCDEGY